MGETIIAALGNLFTIENFIALISPPTVEAVRAMSSARRGCPPWHMG